MYDYFCAFIVGVVEGLTEYIPVSSTGHMIIVGHMLGFEGTLADLFDVFIQLGAILRPRGVQRKIYLYPEYPSLVSHKGAFSSESGHRHVSGLPSGACFSWIYQEYALWSHDSHHRSGGGRYLHDRG